MIILLYMITPLLSRSRRCNVSGNERGVNTRTLSLHLYFGPGHNEGEIEMGMIIS